MDAVKYLKELDRMCRAHQACDGCPILDCGKIGCGVSDSAPIELVDTVEIVEQWAKEHPVETRQSRFLNEFPNAIRTTDGTIRICPKYVDTGAKCAEAACDECKREYWSEEIKDEGN